MTIQVKVNNRTIRPENVTVIEPPKPLIERRTNWDVYRNWLVMRGDYEDVA